ncbi:major facilitator superfamily domain-containing protein [Cokeromyces recurvatus]|uniref:major facilitator superfamily domain-containing protein n=1 Tax=Cokeromyces recurvatus TaxID=90255 RepID=UPI00221EF036|nr:major facilitator superfamily domain-containing protein [Cokeromyces recurvatus]KAI7902391.1 major facilitator superfamily domain-containing protein [Cokeromyces recurvatus]
MVKKKPIFLRFRSSNLYILATVSMSLFTDMIVYSIIVPIMPFIIDALEHGQSPNSENPYNKEITDGGNVSKETGSLLALFAVGLLVGSPILGYLADRLEHRRWPMVTGILGLLGATFLFLFANSYWELYLARFLQGLSDACVWTLGMCLIADTFPIEVLGTQMGRVLLFHSIGLVCGSPIGGTLYQSVGYKAPFILCICLAGIDLILRLLVVERRNQPPEWFENDATTNKLTVTTNTLVDHENQKEKKKITVFQLLRQHRLLAGLLLAFANGCVYNVFEPTLTVRLSTEWGYNSSQIGLVFLAQVIPTFIATPLAGYLTDKYGSKVVAITSLVICCITMFLIGIPNKSTAGGVVPLIVIFAIQGFTAFSFITPVLPEITHVVQSLNSDNGGGDDGQGMSYGLFNVTFGLGGLVGPLLGGYLYDRIGFFYMCVVIGCFLALCVPYIFVYTGEPGKFIVRLQDKSNKSQEMIEIDEEIKALETRDYSKAVTNNTSGKREEV